VTSLALNASKALLGQRSSPWSGGVAAAFEQVVKLFLAQEPEVPVGLEQSAFEQPTADFRNPRRIE